MLQTFYKSEDGDGGPKRVLSDSPIPSPDTQYCLHLKRMSKEDASASFMAGRARH